MAIGDIITAARFNSMRDTLRTVLGTNNSGDEGYGQYVLSSAQTAQDEITHTDMVNLYIDMYRARVHQTGRPPQWTSSPEGLSYPSTGDIIGEFAAAVGPTDSSDATENIDMGYVDFEAVSSDIQADGAVFSSSQMSQESLTSSVRTNIWNGTISHILTVAFDGYTINHPDGSTELVSPEDHRRYFFNTGGNIQFDATLTGGLSNTSGTKDYDWATMLTNMGTITFTNYSTYSSGTGTGSSLGNVNLTSSYTTIFQKTGSGVYAENDYTIRARVPRPNAIQFEITFNDDDAGDEPVTPVPPGGIVGGVDENVNGSTSSFVNILRADGDNVTINGQVYSTVSIPTPSVVNNALLGSAPIPAPEPTPPPPPPPPVTGDTAFCVSVLDESSTSSTTIRNDWLSFRSNWPNRTFWLLEPITTFSGDPREPAEFFSDPLTGNASVSTDFGNPSNASDWFDIIGLGSEPSGTIISLSVDNSGSITTGKVRASYDLFKQKCAAAGFILVEQNMGESERWALPHNVSLP